MKNLITPPPKSSFLGYEKDVETILKKLFIESKPYCNDLIKLLVINTKDCLDAKNKAIYDEKIKDYDLPTLKEKGYIRLSPALKIGEHEEVRSYVFFDFDDYERNATNPQFRDCTVYITAICHMDEWDLGDYRLRPYKIIGYIDGLLNETRLSGIGKLEFMSCKQLILSEDLAGYTLSYRAIHGSDDVIPSAV